MGIKYSELRLVRFFLIFLSSTIVIILISSIVTPQHNAEVEGKCTLEKKFEKYCRFNCSFYMNEKNVTGRAIVTYYAWMAIFDKTFYFHNSTSIIIELPRRNFKYQIGAVFYSNDKFAIFREGHSC